MRSPPAMRVSTWVTALGAAAALCSAAPASAKAQNDADRIQMGVGVAPESVTVGDAFRVVVRVRAPRGAEVKFPGVDSVDAVEQLDPARIATADTGAADRTATYRIVAWETGVVAIPLGDVTVTIGGEARRIPVEGASVFVRSVLPADTTLHVPKPARDLLVAPVSYWKWWLAGALAALLLGLLFWAWWRRRRRGHAPVPLDPRLIAEREFSRIEAMGLVEAGERERYVALMIEVLRDYLAGRVGVARASLTTSELLAALRTDPRVPVPRLEPVLDQTDLVKFASASITAERAKEIGRETRAIVEQVEQSVAARAERDRSEAA